MVPLGVDTVPPEAISDAVAVHIVVAPLTRFVGLQLRAVVVPRAVMTQVNVVLARAPPLSVAVTVTVELPTVVGVPEMAPVEGLRVRPDGSPVAE